MEESVIDGIVAKQQPNQCSMLVLYSCFFEVLKFRK